MYVPDITSKRIRMKKNSLISYIYMYRPTREIGYSKQVKCDVQWEINLNFCFHNAEWIVSIGFHLTVIIKQLWVKQETLQYHWQFLPFPLAFLLSWTFNFQRIFGVLVNDGNYSVSFPHLLDFQLKACIICVV